LLTYRSIGLRGTASIQTNSKPLSDPASELAKFSSLCAHDIIGVGYIFLSREIFFTVNSNVVYEGPLPEKMKNLKLYPSISMCSRDDVVEFIFDSALFRFNLSAKLEVIKIAFSTETYIY
jgi:hypothetical protein